MTLQPAGMNSHRKHSSTCALLTGTGPAWALVLLCAPAPGAAEVVFSGIDGRLEANVRALSPLATTSCDSARWRVDRLFRDADKKIVEALRALGYYEPVIDKTLRWDPDCWHAEFRIDPGQPVRLREVNIEFQGEAARDRVFLNRLPAERPQTGQVLDHGQYSTFKESVLRAAINTGFFDADFEHNQVLVDKQARSADLELRLSSGPKYRFGELTFSQGVLQDGLLRRYTDIEPGDPYSSKAINDLYEALNGSRYFSSVAIQTDPVNADAKTVPVNVQLTPAKRRSYAFGGGFSTDLGPYGRIGYLDRRINDRGHQFESNLFGSEVTTEIDGAYRIPRKDPRHDWFSIVGGYQHENTDTSEHDTYKLGVLRTKRLGSEWLQSRYLDYQFENFKVADQDSDSQLVIIGTSFEKVRGRSLSRATNGYRLSFNIRGASDSLGSDTSFLQIRTRAKWVRAFTEKSRLLARVSLSGTAKDELEDLPASVRFFAGGDQSVRGYEYESLGPVDDEGEVIGGSHQIDASLEIDYFLRNKWAIAAFVDTGDAFNDTDIELSTGVGIGIRWYSPVGPIRLDFAHPLDNPDEDFRIHISLGPDL